MAISWMSSSSRASRSVSRFARYQVNGMQPELVTLRLKLLDADMARIPARTTSGWLAGAPRGSGSIPLPPIAPGRASQPIDRHRYWPKSDVRRIAVASRKQTLPNLSRTCRPPRALPAPGRGR